MMLSSVSAAALGWWLGAYGLEKGSPSHQITIDVLFSSVLFSELTIYQES